MGVDTIIVTLSMVLTELQLNIQFSVMAAQIIIHMVCGTFSQPVKVSTTQIHTRISLKSLIVRELQSFL